LASKFLQNSVIGKKQPMPVSKVVGMGFLTACCADLVNHFPKILASEFFRKQRHWQKTTNACFQSCKHGLPCCILSQRYGRRCRQTITDADGLTSPQKDSTNEEGRRRCGLKIACTEK